MRLAFAVLLLTQLGQNVRAQTIATVPKVAAHVNAQLQLRLTQTLFQGVLASYFTERDQTFDAVYVSEKSYLQTFLAEWSTRLDTGRYESTSAIFSDISRGHTYLAKYYYRWESIMLMQPQRDAHGLGSGGYKEQFLRRLLESETRFSDLHARLRDVLYYTSLFLVTSGGEPELARTIAQPFLDADDAGVREAARNVMSNIPFERKANLAVLAFNLVGFARGSVAMGNPAKFLTAPRLISQIGAEAAAYARAAGNLTGRFVNPFVRRMNVRRWSFLAASSAHAGAGLLFWPDVNAAAGAPARGNPTIVQMTYLWDGFNTQYPDAFPLISDGDFAPTFRSDTREAMIARVRARLRGEGPLDFAREFILAEKLAAIDNRDPGDLFAAELVQGRYDQLKARVATLFGNGPITDEKIEAFRQLVIDQAVHNYKRDYPNLTMMLGGWGGNCVAETMLMISLLEPYRAQLPHGMRLAIALTPIHIEASLYDGRTLQTLVAGERTTEIAQTVYRPEYLLLLLLRNYSGALDGFKIPNLVEYWPAGSAGALAGGGSGGIFARFKQIFNDRRLGVMDTNSGADLSAASQGADGDDPDIPYEAQIGYSQTSERVGGSRGGGFGSLRSRLSGLHFGRTLTKPRPKLNIAVNLKPQPFVLIDFQYDPAQQTVTAFSEAAFSELMRARGERNMDDAKYEKIVLRKMLDRLTKIVDLPLIQKLYVAPQHAADAATSFRALVSTSDAELVLHQTLMNEYARAIALLFYVAPPTTRFNFSAPLIKIDNPTGESLDGPSLDAETIAKFRALAAGEVRLTQEIARDPGRFLQIFGEAPLMVRNHLLVRFFGASFWRVVPERTDDYPSLTLAKNSVRDYLSAVDKIKVDFNREQFWLCDQDRVKINLPVVKDWAYTEESNTTCGSSPELTNATTTVRGRSAPTEASSANLPRFKISTLIELTVGFGEGLQLWTPEVVDAFVHRRYEQIGPDHETALSLIRNTVLSDPTLARDPRFAQLR